MSNATFSRKPLVAAVLTTLAVFSAGAMAGETEEAKTNVELTIGTAESTTDKTVAGTVQNEQTWDEAWAKKFGDKFTNASGTVTIGEGTDASHKTITIGKGTDDKTAGKLTNNLSSLTLNVGLDVAEGGTFVNNGTLEANKAITVTGSLVNTGTLKINNNLTINGLDKTTDLEAAPASVVMGDITLKNATLTNHDKGYTLKTEAEKKEGEADKKPETRARVSYGNVTLKTGGKFVNFAEALDTGSSLTIASDADTAEINGKSTWGTIKAQKENAVTVGDKGTLSADVLEYGYDAGNTAKISDLVSVTGGGKFTVNKSLIVSSFANGGSFDLSKDKNKYLASGASLTFGKAQAFKQVDDARVPSTARSMPTATTIRATSRFPTMRPSGKKKPPLPRPVPKAMPKQTRRVPGMSPSSAPSRSTTTPGSRFPTTRQRRLTTSQNMATRPPCRSATSRSIRRSSR